MCIVICCIRYVFMYMCMYMLYKIYMCFKYGCSCVQVCECVFDANVHMCLTVATIMESSPAQLLQLSRPGPGTGTGTNGVEDGCV